MVFAPGSGTPGEGESSILDEPPVLMLKREFSEPELKASMRLLSESMRLVPNQPLPENTGAPGPPTETESSVPLLASRNQAGTSSLLEREAMEVSLRAELEVNLDWSPRVKVQLLPDGGKGLESRVSRPSSLAVTKPDEAGGSGLGMVNEELLQWLL